VTGITIDGSKVSRKAEIFDDGQFCETRARS
jgi:hypothetical protein